MSTTLLKAVADLELALAAAVTAGSTTATLSSASDGDDVALPSGLYGFTIDRLTDSKEYIVCNLSSTALTNIVSISKQGASTTGFVNYHRKNATVEITDWAVLKRMLNNLDGTTGFDSGTNLGYDGAPTGLTANQFATVNYVLSVVSGGTVNFDQQVSTNQTLGETLAVNDLVYFKAADSRWWGVDADDTTTFAGLKLGINKTAGNAGSSATIAISGPVTGFTGLTAGVRYYASNTKGSITTSAAQTYTVPIGWALSTTSILLSPYNTSLDVYRGSAESSANTIVTSNALVLTPTDQTQTTQDTTSTVGEADATTKHNKLAQSFIAGTSVRRIRGVTLYKSADTGTFTGTVTVSLQADSAGAPSGSSLASVVTTNAVWIVLGVGPQNFIFSSEYTSLTPGSTYWIVVSTSTSDNSNHPNLGANSAGGYSSGSVKFTNVTDGWTAVATIDLYFKTLLGQVGNVPGGDSNGTIPAEILPLTAPVVNVYTSTGANTWTKPTASNFRYAIVEVQGGGAAGGAANGTNGNMGGGGGAGGYVRKLYAASALSATVVATVGAVATDSTFAALGGTLTGSAGVAGTADTGAAGAGGAATGGDLNIPGQAGGRGGPNGTSTSTGSGAGGGNSFLGRGGPVTPVGNGDANGVAGTGYGAGGAGGYRQVGNATAGAGTQGIIIVTEYYL